MFRFLKLLTKRLSSAARFGSEAVLAVLAVLGCFILFIFALRGIFPEGDPTQFWLLQGRDLLPASLGKRGGEIEARLPEGSGANLGDGGALAARLTFAQNEVKSKRSDEIVWSGARTGMPLFDRDAVQTLARSAAVITFDEKNYLDMDENSLVIIKRLERNPILKERRSFMVVIDGNLRGRIDASGSENTRLEIATPTAVTQINARKGGRSAADFQIRVNPDQTSTVTVYAGVATVVAQGVTVEVNENQATHIGLNAPPENPQPIQPPVTLSAPSEGTVSFYRDFPAEITFVWSPQEKAARYHLQIAREASFRKRVLDQMTEQTAFLYGNLRAGQYVWRVASISGGGVEGQWSEARGIKVVQKRTPPALLVSYPKGDEVINRERIWVRGRSDTDAKVYVNGKRVPNGVEGRFKKEVRLNKGINLVLVESVDPAGNVRFEKRIISRKF